MMPPKNLAAVVCDVVIMLFAVALTAAAFHGEPAEPYLFPRILAVALLALCAAQLLLSARGGGKGAGGGAAAALKHNAAVIAIIVLYVAAAETVGFYVSAGAVFFAVAYLRGRGRYRAVAAGVCALAAVGVLYALFSLLLRVQTPSGWLF